MARAPYKVEIESEFNRLAAEEAGHQNLTEYYKSLLTGASQTAEKYAQTQYAQMGQTAAEQASYDISGAYANYLKQQRNIAAQGHLESGYIEEVEDVLQQQYQSAYNQARAAQASALTSAKKTAQDLYSNIYGELSKSATAQIEAIEKQSKIKANLANSMIEQAQLSGDKTFDWFTLNKEGNTVLSDWGYDQMSKYLMSGEYDFGKYLQDKNLIDELEYYLSDPAGVRKEFFGITEKGYDPMSQEAIARRIRTEGYVESIAKPTFNDKDSMEADFADMTAQLTTYATQLGLTDEDIRVVLRGSTIKDFVNEFGIDEDEYQEQLDSVTEYLQLYADYKYGLSDIFVTTDRYDWAIAKNGGGGRGLDSTYRGGFTTH